MALTRFPIAALLALCAWLATPAFAAIDEDDLLPIEEAFALQARALDRDSIELVWTVAEGYYLYRHRMGAEATEPGFTVAALDLPAGTRTTDEFFGETETYRSRVTAVVRGMADAGASEAVLRVRYQGCADVGVCYPPHSSTVRVALPAGGGAVPAGFPAPSGLPLGSGSGKPLFPVSPVDIDVEALPLPPEQAFGFEAIAVGHDQLLLRFTPIDGYYVYRDRSSFRLVAGADAVALGEPQWPASTAHHDDHFGDVAVYFQQIEVPLPLRRLSAAAADIRLEATFQGCQDNGVCYPPMTRQVALSLPALPAGETPSSAAPAAAGMGLGLGALLLALLAAMLGGLILNLMPCVLPVLSLKALSLADSAHDRLQARRSALWYTAGVLVSFAAVGLAAIALRQAGLALGWGFQLQQPWVVGLLAYVMFAVGLSLSGVFQIGVGLAGVGQGLVEKNGAAGDFFTGVLAVVVASPCTAPFMGPALAFAFAAPASVALMVFFALGLGLALPFLLIGFVPALASRLPRPGAWMVAFKQVMAFPMYLTAAWLVWVLAKQRGADAVGLLLVGGVLLAGAAWGLERLRWRPRPAGIALALAAAFGAVAALPAIQQLPLPTQSTSTDDSVAYSAERLADLRRGGRVVFVNMTADWCVTCKANEARVLSGEGFRNAMAAADAVYMKGDWTNVDPAITRFLEAHGAVGVPLYVVFGAGDGPGHVLPTVLSLDTVVDALRSARGQLAGITP
jgi:thiol:disulfide interchange protein